MQILVTGSNGQLGNELQVVAKQFLAHQFTFTNRTSLDVTNEIEVNAFFNKNQFDVIINAAAYTAVDKAETEKEAAYAGNALAPKYLATAAKNQAAKLIHISTDYVFDGAQQSPYVETDATNPINYYGQTKLDGENFIKAINTDAYIIRTSWVYSSFGHNFVKTMLKLMATKPEINVVADQVGVPTYAASLAFAIIKLIEHPNFKTNNGILHYTNSGTPISWFQFAQAIAQLINSNCKVNPIPTSDYPTPATRSAYSALDNYLFKNTFNIEIPNWETDLKACLQLLIPNTFVE